MEYTHLKAHPNSNGECENKNRIFPPSELEIKRIKSQENTVNYIQNYLTPHRKWKKEITAKQRIALIRNADVDWIAIERYIRSMDYQDFLATSYWKTIAAHTKYRAGYRCQLCNDYSGLITHHRSYDIHGREHAHMNELTVLCNECHQKFHTKKLRYLQSDNSRYIPTTDVVKKSSPVCSDSFIIIDICVIFIVIVLIIMGLFIGGSNEDGNNKTCMKHREALRKKTCAVSENDVRDRSKKTRR